MAFRKLRRSIYKRLGLNDHKLDKYQAELKRLHDLPRYEPTTTNLFGPTLQVPDGKSFFYGHKEVVENAIYDFRCETDSPLIIDGGANIGLSVIFFKQRFPNAKIIAFEADPKIFQVLTHNVGAMSFDDVTLIQKALWTEETTLRFDSEGADAGRIGIDGLDVANSIEVPTIRLSTYLDQSIDFLKLDIEGAEVDVIAEAQAQLGHVERMFVEFHSFTGQKCRLVELLQTIEESGFKYHLQTMVYTPQPFMGIQDYCSIEMGINISAIRPEKAAA